LLSDKYSIHVFYALLPWGGDPMIDIRRVIEFVKPFYENNDIMHDLSHALRVLKAAKMLAEDYQSNVDLDLVVFGSCFHGMISEHETEIVEFLKSLDLSEKKVPAVTKVSWESLKEQVPESLEGKIVHVAHLIEGGKTFMIVKSLTTGSLRSQTLKETIEYLENSVIGKNIIATFHDPRKSTLRKKNLRRISLHN
jgi:uncharacterized protein